MHLPTSSLSGRHALVCGASSGIGRASAHALAAQGATVTVLARRAALLDELVAELRASGASAPHALPADLDDRDGLEAAVRDLVGARGPVHVLVNNAGGPPPGPLVAATEAAFLEALGRHLFASHRLVQVLLPGMTEAGFGRIINIISTSVKEPIPNLGVSNTTRGAMASWAKSLSRELPPGVTINNVLPGFTDTARLGKLAHTLADRQGRTPDQVRAAWMAQVPEGRTGEVGELAAAVAFLASPAAAYIRGVSLPVDGGRCRSI